MAAPLALCGCMLRTEPRLWCVPHRLPAEPYLRIPWRRTLEVPEPFLKIARLCNAAVAEVGDLVVLVLVEDIMKHVEVEVEAHADVQVPSSSRRRTWPSGQCQPVIWGMSTIAFVALPA